MLLQNNPVMKSMRVFEVLGNCILETVTFSPYEIFSEELWHNVLYIPNINLIDQPINTFLQRLPRHTLVLFTSLIRNLTLQRPQPRRRHVGPSRASAEQLVVLLLRELLLVLRGQGFRVHGPGGPWAQALREMALALVGGFGGGIFQDGTPAEPVPRR